MKTKAVKKERENLCSNCAKCCGHISVEIDKPTTQKEYDNIIWFLLHKNVFIWIDDEEKWYIEFSTPCKGNVNNLCALYERRPDLCREYKAGDCIGMSDSPAEEHIFKDPDEFLDYIESKNKKYRGKYKRAPAKK